MNDRDRQRIRERVETYFFSLDARDSGLTAACFTSDASIVHRSGEQNFSGGLELADALAVALAPYRSTIHALANLRIEAAGDEARVRYSALVTLEPAGDSVLVRGVRYDDEMVRAGDEWLISRRFHEPLWQFAAPTQPRPTGTGLTRA